MKRSTLQKVYVSTETEEKTRLGEKEFLVRNPPVFAYEPVKFWNRFIKFMTIEKVL